MAFLTTRGFVIFSFGFFVLFGSLEGGMLLFLLCKPNRSTSMAITMSISSSDILREGEIEVSSLS
jgi:hypothetical protein